MSTANFKEGQIVFTTSGHRAQYVCASERNHVIRLEMEDAEGETYFDCISVEQKVFAEAPRAVHDAEVRKLLAERSELSGQIRQLRTDLRNAETDSKARVGLLKRHTALQLLEDYIEGRITHYVVKSYDGPRVLPFADAICGSCSEYRRDKLRLLSLFGDSKGNLSYNLNRYSDGSGSGGEEVYPCTSLEAAEAKARELVELMFVNLRMNLPNFHGWGYAKASALRVGVEIPVDLQAHANALAVSAAAERLAKAKDAMAKDEAIVANGVEA